LRDGTILVKGRFHNILKPFLVNERSSESLYKLKGEITRIIAGEHANLTHTVKESLDLVDLRTAICNSQNLHFDLTDAII
jgi:hypothetical protein